MAGEIMVGQVWVDTQTNTRYKVVALTLGGAEGEGKVHMDRMRSRSRSPSRFDEGDHPKFIVPASVLRGTFMVKLEGSPKLEKCEDCDARGCITCKGLGYVQVGTW